VNQPKRKITRFDWLRIGSPGDVEWDTYDLRLPPATSDLEGLRLLHLSDLHLTRRWHRAYDQLLADIETAQFDVITVTGDIIDNRWNPTVAVLKNLQRFLSALRSRLGTFAILGNHDGDLLAPYVNACDTTLLHPGRATISVGEALLELIGLPSVHRLDLTRRLLRKIPAKPDNAFRVVLSHYPDHVRKIGPLNANLVLAGHTHGGQVCWPNGRPIITHDALPKEMSVGKHEVGNTQLIVSRGIGFATYAVRAFAAPQAAEIRFT
jgi:hypothetical protein